MSYCKICFKPIRLTRTVWIDEAKSRVCSWRSEATGRLSPTDHEPVDALEEFALDSMRESGGSDEKCNETD